MCFASNVDLEKKICPFCKTSLNHHIEYDYCLTGHFWIRDNKTYIFRILFDNYYLRWSGHDGFTIEKDDYSERIKVPFFDPFEMSLDKLKERIDLYALYS